MKTIGLLGGMSWESTLSYYSVINETVQQTLGGLHSAQCLLYSVDFAPLAQYQEEGRWDEEANVLTEAALCLEKAGADFIVICSNTPHKVAPQIRDALRIPLLHIAEVTADKLLLSHITKVGLLGTRYTLTESFYREILEAKGLAVVLPEASSVERLNSIIFDELCLGITREKSKAYYVRVIESMVAQGAQGIILGCTELGELIQSTDVSVPLFDTAYLHARAAALYALSDDENRSRLP